ncbi:hypothetical protein B0H14DRAFT_2579554 [Mycena olivaceomarginata]|nr:hypothetical protein B0H14DRAFT_2579554 [Mycena olivaceomarginata]
MSALQLVQLCLSLSQSLCPSLTQRWFGSPQPLNHPIRGGGFMNYIQFTLEAIPDYLPQTRGAFEAYPDHMRVNVKFRAILTSSRAPMLPDPIRFNALWMKETLVLPEPHRVNTSLDREFPETSQFSGSVPLLMGIARLGHLGLTDYIKWGAAIEHWENFTCIAYLSDVPEGSLWLKFHFKAMVVQNQFRLPFCSDVIFNFFGDVEARLWFNWLEAKYDQYENLAICPQTAALSAILEYLLPKATEIDWETCIMV